MAYERTLEDIDNVVFDLDGTVWEWNRLKDGVKRTIETLHQHDKTIKYLTNNAILRREQYAEKLRNLGIPVDDEDVLCASYIASQALDDEGVRDVFVVGEEGLRAELGRNKINHVEDANHALVAVDRNFSYWKMAEAADILRNGGTLWATSVDPYWWAGDRHLPGTNALTTAIQRSAGREEIQILGKPSKYAATVVKEEWGLRPTNTVMIGDNVDSDVVFGNRMGFMTGLVMGGSTTENDLGDLEREQTPDIVFRAFQRIVMKL